MSARVYSYIRFSDIKQAAGASSERQAAYAAQWAQEHGLELDTELSMRDEGLSAYHQRHVKRGALGVFLKAVEDGRVPGGSVLVVEGLDRLSRAEPIQAQAQLTSIITAGITVVTASDGKAYSRESLRTNPMDLVYSLLVMIRAHEESDTKSKRVRDAIRRQCRGWMEGTYRGLIRYGNTPRWLRAVDGRWQIIEERAMAIQTAVDLYRQGLGLMQIIRRLGEQGMSLGGDETTTRLVRLFALPALAGDKVLQLDGEEFVLEDYFPAIVTREVWSDLQRIRGERRRDVNRSTCVSILTGSGVAKCGYCGAPMKAQFFTNKARHDGTLADGHRRLQCSRANAAAGCIVAGSCSSAPIERALMTYCSDIMNLQALFGPDMAAGPRHEHQVISARLSDIEQKLERLTDAMLDTSGPIPTTFASRARELEQQREEQRGRLAEVQRALATATKVNVTGAEAEWAALRKSVEAMDPLARSRARQLVIDTFDTITVWHHGLRPDENRDDHVDVMLLAKGGTARLLRISRKSEWIVLEDAAV